MIQNYILPFYTPTDKVIVKSDDCYLFDSEGKKYIDFESGVWCSNVGHCNKTIHEVLVSQAQKLVHHGYKFQNHQSEKLSTELLRISGINKGASVFLSSGSEAVNLSIRIAQHLTGNMKVLKISDTYLSAYGYGQITSDNTNVVEIKANDYKSLERLEFNDIAALVLEFGGASINVVQFLEYEFTTKLVQTAKNNNCIIIAEEVTTGFGRTGKWFGYQHYDFLPDIVSTGKALGNGYPISAVTINDELNKLLEENIFRYAQSHQNDPLGCAIAIEVIRLIEQDNLIKKSSLSGEYFIQQLKALKSKYSIIKDIRGKGLMLALELESNIDGEYIHSKLFESGFVVGYKENKFRFMPPLTIQVSDIDSLINNIDTILSKVTAK